MEPLLHLSLFSPETKFLILDDVDKSMLLAADVSGINTKDIYSEKNFCIAVWHEDLLEMHERGIIAGIKPVTERGWNQHRWEKLTQHLPKGAALFYEVNGKKIPLNREDFYEEENEEEKDESFNQRLFAVSVDGYMSVTQHGRGHILAHLQNKWAYVKDGVGRRVAHLYDLGYFDTAIREACVQLEHNIRLMTGSRKCGKQLVGDLVAKLRDEGRELESDIRNYQQELRSIFAFIRNEFMHNLHDADAVSALAMLYRVARASAIRR